MIFAYRSSPCPGLSAAEFVAIGQTAWRRNNANGISGLLVYDGASFRQMIEGPPHVVSPVVAIILTDPRHTNIEVLDLGFASQCQYDQWSCIGFDRFDNNIMHPARTVAETARLVRCGVHDLGSRRVEAAKSGNRS